jgi:hypothetical protein
MVTNCPNGQSKVSNDNKRPSIAQDRYCESSAGEKGEKGCKRPQAEINDKKLYLQSADAAAFVHFLGGVINDQSA